MPFSTIRRSLKELLASLKPNLKGAAMKDLQNRLKVQPNAFLQWSQFLYQAATILGVRNNEFIVKTRAEDGTPTGIISIVPDSWELVEYENEPWVRFILPNNKRRAERLAETGILTRFQYKSELFGENNDAMNPVLDLIKMQRQGITEGIKNGNSYRFWAKSDNWASDEDLGEEMERYNKFTFGNKKAAGGVLLFPNTYDDIHEMKASGYTVDKEQQEDRERIGYGNQIFFSSNRLQYMSNADKLNAVTQLGDRGLATRNELREILNLDPLPEPYGDQIPTRGEYYDVTNPPNKKAGDGAKGDDDNADENK